MHTHFRTKAIFLKKEDRSETDRVFTVFTEDFGKIEIMGRSIRKITSKLKGGADVFYFSEIEFIEGKTQKTLTDAILINNLSNLRNNCEKLSLAYEIAEAMNFLIVKEEKDERIWRLLLEVFQSLNLTQSLNHLTTQPLLYHYFLWNLFSLLGYSPELYNCAVCGKKLLPETFFFAPQEGGVICWACFGKLKKEKNKEESANLILQPRWGQEITVGAVKVLRFFLKEPLKSLERLVISEKDRRTLTEISEFYLAFLKEAVSP